MLKRFLRSTTAASGTEYGMLAGLIGVVVITSAVALGTQTESVFTSTQSEMETALNTQDEPVVEESTTPPPPTRGAVPDEEEEEPAAPPETCYQDTAGDDSMTPRSLGDAVTCIDISTGNDQVNISGYAHTVTVNTLNTTDTSNINLTSTDNNEVINAEGTNRHLYMTMGTGTTTVNVPGYNLGDFNFSRLGNDVIFHHKSNAVKLDLRGSLSEANYASNNYVINFADQSVNSSDIYDLTMEMYENNSTVSGTFMNDTVDLRCAHTGGATSHWMGNGDDTGNYISGTISWGGQNGYDVIDMSATHASTDVSFHYNGVNGYISLPDGQRVHVPNWKRDFDNGDTDVELEAVVFSDQIMTLSDIAAVWTENTNSPTYPDCSATAIPGPSQGHTLGGPDGPTEIAWPYMIL